MPPFQYLVQLPALAHHWSITLMSGLRPGRAGRGQIQAGVHHTSLAQRRPSRRLVRQPTTCVYLFCFHEFV